MNDDPLVDLGLGGCIDLILDGDRGLEADEGDDDRPAPVDVEDEDVADAFGRDRRYHPPVYVSAMSWCSTAPEPDATPPPPPPSGAE